MNDHYKVHVILQLMFVFLRMFCGLKFPYVNSKEHVICSVQSCSWRTVTRGKESWGSKACSLIKID